MTQLTPEELAACAVRAWNSLSNAETRLLGYGSFEKGYIAARAESAKEIAKLQHINSIQSDFLSSRQCSDHNGKWQRGRCLQCEIEQLKAQVEGLRKDLISCRGSVKTDLNQTERMLLAKEKHNEQDTPIYTAASAEVRRLFELKERIDAAIAQEKSND